MINDDYYKRVAKEKRERRLLQNQKTMIKGTRQTAKTNSTDAPVEGSEDTSD